jgi:hypothetical protein
MLQRTIRCKIQEKYSKPGILIPMARLTGATTLSAALQQKSTPVSCVNMPL